MQFASRTTVQVEASADCGIAWVEVYLNGKRFAMMNEAPFQIPLDPVADRLPPGTYTLTARAIDIFNNEATSAPVKIIVGSPGGFTQLNADLGQAVDTNLIGLLPVTLLELPSGGSSLERQPFSNLVLPQTPWSDASSMLPNMLAAESRVDPSILPSMDVLALLPVKSVPEQEPGAALPLCTVQGVASTPVLAALPSMLSPATAAASSLTPTSGVLLVPVGESPHAATVNETLQPGSPMLVIPLEWNTPGEKASPAPDKAAAAESALKPVQHSAAPAAAVTPAHHPQAPVVKSTRPMLVAKAPELADAHGNVTVPVTPATRGWLDTGELPASSLPAPSSAAVTRTLPAAGTAPALGRVLMAKAEPSADAAQTDGNFVLYTPVSVECAPDTASCSRAVNTSPAQSNSIECGHPIR